jgi:hypothetical protein
MRLGLLTAAEYFAATTSVQARENDGQELPGDTKHHDQPAARRGLRVHDGRNDALWRKGVSKSAPDRPGVTAVGSQSTETMRFMGRDVLTRSEITEAVPNQKMAFRSDYLNKPLGA